MQTCGELTLAWNGSLCRVSNPSSLPLMIYGAGPSSLRLISKEARSPTFQLDCFLFWCSPSEGKQRKQDSKVPLRRGPEQTFKPS